ncbi:MAG: hypothetical protein QM647_05990 [Asticcacaulis sp.]|uniref:DUF6880 family protein n=1 Tax=Asticcacaulis sp. TaxID=1872648 RepID=UPI0039E3C2FF
MIPINLKMVSKTALNAKNLESLGTHRLAALLMEVSEGNANARRRLRLELAGSESPDKLANEIRKRLTVLAEATSNIGPRTLKGFRGDLNSQRKLIMEQVLPDAPQLASELMWQFIGLGDLVIERSGDSTGETIEIFKAACDDVGYVEQLIASPAEELYRRTAAVQMANSYGQNDKLISAMTPLLGPQHLVELRELIRNASKHVPRASRVKPRTGRRWRKRLLSSSELLTKRTPEKMMRVSLLSIADALGDVDAYIALMADAYNPNTATQIALRLLKANRANDALIALDRARLASRLPMPSEWIGLRIDALELLDRKAEAQKARLDQFHQTLEPHYLREYLKRLPDFEDVEAEDEVLDQVLDFPDPNEALTLLISWPSPQRAAELVKRRVFELDGKHTITMGHAADRLSARYPLAAVMLHRQIVEASLDTLLEPAHAAAAINALEAESLSRHVEDFDRYDNHETWMSKLTTAHSRRRAFWNALA